jgi:hypothetical protein
VQNTSGDACSKIVRHRQAIIPDLILLTCFDDYSCASQGSVLKIMGLACDYQFLKACQLSSRRSPRIESTAALVSQAMKRCLWKVEMLLDSQIRLLAHGKAQGSVILSLGNDESDTTVNFGIQK